MSTPQSEQSPVRTRRSADEIRGWIIGEISRALNIDPSEVDPAAPLDSHGVDSLAAISITGRLSSWLDRSLQATLMWDYPTVEAIAQHLAHPDAVKPASLPRGVIPMQTQGNRTPIFFFPGVGGHPVTFMALATQLGTSWPCYGLTVPGLDNETEPLSRIEDMAAAMTKTLRLVQAKGPYQLAGYSFGGLLAYEAARQLSEAGEKVSMLAIYDAFTPGGRTPRPLWQRLAVHICLLLERPGRLTYLRDRIDRLRGARDVKNGEVNHAVVGADDATEAKVKLIQKLNSQAAKHYQPRPYPGSALLFLASVRPKHDLFYKSAADGGWGALCGGGVHVIKLPGSHLNILDGDHVPIAADMLRPHLSRGLAEEPCTHSDADSIAALAITEKT